MFKGFFCNGFFGLCCVKCGLDLFYFFVLNCLFRRWTLLLEEKLGLTTHSGRT
jgi:hypothetical protein